MDALFFPEKGTNKSCRQIEKRVKQLKAKKKISLDSTFLRKLRQAIFWRTIAAIQYSSLETQKEHQLADDNTSHGYFIDLLAWTNQQLQERITGLDEKDTIELSNIFEHLVLEEVSDFVPHATAKGLEDILARDDIDLTTTANKDKSLLEADQLSTILQLLAELRELMTCARNYCNDMHNGKANVPTTSLMLSVIYTEVKSKCFETALLVDKWSEVDTWVEKDTWKEFGLDEYHDNLKFIVILKPMLYTYLKGLDPNDTPYELSPGHHFTNPSVEDYIPELSELASREANDMKNMIDTEIAVDAMQHYTGDRSLNAGDLVEMYQNRDSPLHQSMSKVDFLRKALQAFSQRRKDHDRRKLKSTLVENPVLVDLHDFLTGTNPVAAIAVMLGIGFLHTFVGATNEEFNMIDTSLRRGLLLQYHNHMHDIASDIPSDTGSIEGHQFRPGTLVSVPNINPISYASLLPCTDVWTFGLCVTQVAAACNETILKYLLTTKCSQDGNPFHEFPGLLYTFDFLQLCGGTTPDAAFENFIERLRQMHGHMTKPKS